MKNLRKSFFRYLAATLAIITAVSILERKVFVLASVAVLFINTKYLVYDSVGEMFKKYYPRLFNKRIYISAYFLALIVDFVSFYDSVGEAENIGLGFLVMLTLSPLILIVAFLIMFLYKLRKIGRL